eukprot:Amastigsp_a12670_12.p2 type:complete len:145 gc:universal Amastigsp_a12670_12:454-20(-)
MEIAVRGPAVHGPPEHDVLDRCLKDIALPNVVAPCNPKRSLCVVRDDHLRRAPERCHESTKPHAGAKLENRNAVQEPASAEIREIRSKNSPQEPILESGEIRALGLLHNRAERHMSDDESAASKLKALVNNLAFVDYETLIHVA